MNLIEKGARALFAQATDHALLDNEEIPAHWFAHARAVIEAIREPTEAMIDAGDAICVKHCVLGSQMADIWRAQVGAALQEG